MSIAWWKRPDGEHWLFGYVFNEYDERRPWTTILHGRGFLHLGSRVKLNAEWLWFTSRCHIGIEVNASYERDVLLKLALPGLVSLYLGVEGLLPAHWLPRDERTTDLRIFDQAIWWEVWRDTSSWTCTTPRWRSGSWHPLDTIFGRMVYQEIPLSEERTVIPLPEGLYPCTVKLTEARWKRPRGFCVTRRLSGEVIPDTPLPIPGKGTMSYNCDDDAIYSHGCLARTVEAAVASVVESVLTSRARYGGKGWAPAKGWHPDLVEE